MIFCVLDYLSSALASEIIGLLFFFFDWHVDLTVLASICQEMTRRAGTVNWGTATLVGVFAGMLYGGSKEASASVVSTLFVHIFHSWTS